MRCGVLLLVVGCSYTPPLGRPDGDTDAPIDTPADSASTDAAIDAPPGAITCPGSMCGTVCCDGDCLNATTSVCTGNVFRCDGPEDCGTDQVCCNDQNGSTCVTGTCGGFEVCHTPSDCSFACSDCSFASDYGQQVCCE